MLAGVLLLTGCAPDAPTTDRRPVVFAGMAVMADFVRRLAGEHMRVVNLLPAGADAHDFEPSLRDMTRLREAALFVYNGGGVEHWADKTVRSLAGTPVVVVEASAGLLEADEHTHEEHAHVEHEHEEHDHSDAHIWLDPMLAAAQLRAIANGLVAADPAHAADYETNYAAAAEECTRLDAACHQSLEPFEGSGLVVTHAGYGRFCAAYGLEQVPIAGFSDEEEPSAAQVAKVIDFVRDGGVSTVFFSESGSSAVGETVARETGAKTRVLYTMETMCEDYFAAMYDNLETVTAALKEDKRP